MTKKRIENIMNVMKADINQYFTDEQMNAADIKKLAMNFPGMTEEIANYLAHQILADYYAVHAGIITRW